jgi:hypothetical protein
MRRLTRYVSLRVSFEPSVADSPLRSSLLKSLLPLRRSPKRRRTRRARGKPSRLMRCVTPLSSSSTVADFASPFSPLSPLLLPPRPARSGSVQPRLHPPLPPPALALLHLPSPPRSLPGMRRNARSTRQLPSPPLPPLPSRFTPHLPPPLPPPLPYKPVPFKPSSASSPSSSCPSRSRTRWNRQRRFSSSLVDVRRSNALCSSTRR